ncbi:hypothetical protein [Paracoccus sp. IB05]|nr:hypothetical protein [Paracoccus sp. IB05]MBJ2151773.1 hypothetical protein [Paracoccus sp. IB05]
MMVFDPDPRMPLVTQVLRTLSPWRGSTGQDQSWRSGVSRRKLGIALPA